MVRTVPFHGTNVGSIPTRNNVLMLEINTIIINCLKDLEVIFSVINEQSIALNFLEPEILLLSLIFLIHR